MKLKPHGILKLERMMTISLVSVLIIFLESIGIAGLLENGWTTSDIVVRAIVALPFFAAFAHIVVTGIRKFAQISVKFLYYTFIRKDPA